MCAVPCIAYFSAWQFIAMCKEDKKKKKEEMGENAETDEKWEAEEK